MIINIEMANKIFPENALFLYIILYYFLFIYIIYYDKNVRKENNNKK